MSKCVDAPVAVKPPAKESSCHQADFASFRPNGLNWQGPDARNVAERVPTPATHYMTMTDIGWPRLNENTPAPGRDHNDPPQLGAIDQRKWRIRVQRYA